MAVFLRLRLLQDFRRLGNIAGRSIIVQGANIPAVCSAEGGLLRGAVQCQPVAKLETKIIEVSASSGAVCPINIVHPILHQRVVLLQLGLAAIVIIQHFGNEGGRIAPDPGA